MTTTKKRFEPKGDRVLVRRAKADEKTTGGIIVPDMAKDPPVEGEILAVGNGSWREGSFRAVDFEVGQIVVFGKYSGTAIKLNGEELVILREDDIHGTVSVDVAQVPAVPGTGDGATATS